MDGWLDIGRDELKAAAKGTAFDTVFPLLMRRLIAETADGLTELDMPGESGTALGGYDGVVTATNATTFVPAGTSVWELSVGGGNPKAEDDYSKRDESPTAEPLKDITYVEAILEPWKKARDFAKTHSGEGRWREVRAYNLDKIHTWLESAPATAVWLAERLGKGTVGARALDVWWTETWLQSTQTALGVDAVLAGRETVATALLDRLKSGDAITRVGGDLLPDELRAFVAAAAERADAASSGRTGSRIIAVSDSSTLARLITLTQPLVLLLDDARLAKDLTFGHGHQFVFAARTGQSNDVDVPPVHGEQFAEALTAAGIEETEARRLSTLARRSLLSVRRALAHNPDAFVPDWIEDPSTVKRRLLLAGSWSNTDQADRDAIAHLVEKPYDEVAEECRRFSQDTQTPLVALVDQIWHIVALEDSWTLLAPHLTNDDLAAARAIIVEVLCETDPILPVDAGERLLAQMRGVGLRHSSNLRTGLAQTLAVAAAPGIGQGAKLGNWATGVVQDLLQRADDDTTYQTWASLSDVLSLLAEAAPDTFLRRMRVGLTGPKVNHAEMFKDQNIDGLAFGASSPHSSFLWALETLAWSPEYFDDAVEVLVALAALDPGGKFVNRPLSSLAGLFNVLLPMTEADVEHRKRALDRLLRTHPAVGMRLLPALLPDRVSSTQMWHQRPRFRDWGSTRRYAPKHDRITMFETINDLAVTHLSGSVDGMTTLIDRIDDMSSIHRAQAAEKMEAVAPSLTDDERHALYEALREKVSRHEEFPDAGWALSSEELKPLVLARDALAPTDPIRKHRWLFESDWVHLDGVSDTRIETHRDALAKRQAAALVEVVDDLGVEGAVKLAHTTESAQLVGRALHSYGTAYDIEALTWLESDDPTLVNLASGYLRRRVAEEPDLYADSLVEQANGARTKARLVRMIDDNDIAWSKLDGLDDDVHKQYWSEFNYYGQGRPWPRYLDAARALLKHGGRPAAALNLIHVYADEAATPAVAELVADAFEAITHASAPDPEAQGLHHSMPHLFGILAAHRSTVGAQRCVHLEWQFQRWFAFEQRSPNLEATLIEDPGFFVELIMIMVPESDTQAGDAGVLGTPSEGEDHTDTEAHASSGSPADADDQPADVQDDNSDTQTLEVRRLKAQRAYQVLNSFRGFPGLQADGTVNTQELIDWVNRARELLAQVDRSSVGEEQIGELLARGPKAADGGFLHESLRELLEEVRSDRLVDGLRIGLTNRQSMTFRGQLDGGAQERATAGKMRAEAERCGSWPRARKLLNELADSAEATARFMDSRAERTHRGLER